MKKTRRISVRKFRFNENDSLFICLLRKRKEKCAYSSLINIVLDRNDQNTLLKCWNQLFFLIDFPTDPLINDVFDRYFCRSTFNVILCSESSERWETYFDWFVTFYRNQNERFLQTIVLILKRQHNGLLLFSHFRSLKLRPKM